MNKKLLEPQGPPSKERRIIGGTGLFCRHDHPKPHQFFEDDRNSASRPVSSTSTNPATASLKDFLRQKRPNSAQFDGFTKRSKFTPKRDVPPPPSPYKQPSTPPALQGYTDLPKYLPNPPDRGFAAVSIVVAASSVNMIVVGSIFSFSPFLNTFASYYRDGMGKVAWISSLQVLGTYVTAGLFATELTNKLGCRTVCIGGSVISAGAYASTYLANSSIYLMLTQGLLAGVGFGFMIVPSQVSVGNYFEKNRAAASDAVTSGSGIGTAIFPIVANALIDALGWKYVNLIIAGVILVFGVIMGILMRPLEVKKMKKEYLSYFSTPNSCKICGKNLDSKLYENPYLSLAEYFRKETKGNYEGYEMNSIFKKISSKHECASSNVFFPQPPVDYRALDIKVVPAIDNSEFTNLNSTCGCFSKIGKDEIALQPLARQDVFYTGSIEQLKEYEECMRSELLYRKYTHTDKEVPKTLWDLVFGGESRDNANKKPTKCKYFTGLFKTFKELVDPKLLRNPLIAVIIIADFIQAIGAHIPFVYLRQAAIVNQIEKDRATYLVSIIGLSTFIQSTTLGCISKITSNEVILVGNIMSIFVAGLCMVLTPLAKSFLHFALVAFFYGFFAFCYITLGSILLVESGSLENLTKAFKLQLVFKGIGAGIGPPAAGYIFEYTKSFDGCFYFSAGFLFLSALLNLLLIFISKYCLHQKVLFNKEQNLKTSSEEFIKKRNQELQKNWDQYEKVVREEKHKKKKDQPSKNNVDSLTLENIEDGDENKDGRPDLSEEIKESVNGKDEVDIPAYNGFENDKDMLVDDI